MKTEGLDLLTAYKLLKSGQCKMIMNERTGVIFCGDGKMVMFEYADLSDLYKLIDPRPLTEPVEVVRWMVKYKDKEVFYDHEPTLEECCGCAVTRLSAFVDQEVPEPEPVEIEGVITAAWDSGIRIKIDNVQGCSKIDGKRVICRIVEEP